MIANYYTLFRVAKELQSLAGMKLIECFSQEKDSVILTFFDGETVKHVFFSAKPNSAIIYLDTQFSRAKKNSVDLMPQLIGEFLQNVELLPDDRVITFSFIKFTLVFELFTGASANMLLLSKSNKIIFALNNTDEKIYTPREPNMQGFSEYLGSEDVLKSLSRSDLLLGKHYSSELLQRLNFTGKKIIADLTEQDKLELFKQAEQMINELSLGKNVYILQTKAEPQLSLLPLRAMPDVLFETESVSIALKRARIMKIRYKTENALRREISPRLLSEKTRLEKKIIDCKATDDAFVRINEYNQIGSLLLSQANPKEKPGEMIVLTGYEGEEIEAKLDPKLNLIANAEKYFQKAKKSQRDAKIKQERLPIYQKKYGEVCKLIEEFEAAKDLANIKNFKSEMTKNKIGRNMNPDVKTINEKFKKFDLGEGFTLYVGKNSANNDELTMKFAKPNDLWLHARGTSGSHAVLALNGLAKAPKNILKKAAEITAYYSSARNGKYVPVCYTLKKNVRKPKGANQGAVHVSREEVIMVEPQIPLQEVE